MEERQKMELLPAGWRKFDIMDVTCLMLKLVLKQFFTLLEVDPKMASFSERCWSNELMMCESTACAWWGMAPGLQFSRIASATKADRIGSPWLQIQGTITWDKWSHPFDVLHEVIFLDWQDLLFIPDIIEFNPLLWSSFNDTWKGFRYLEDGCSWTSQTWERQAEGQDGVSYIYEINIPHFAINIPLS